MADDSNSSGLKPPSFADLPTLRIRSDVLKVRHHPFDARGHKVEPEQQPVTRVLSTDAAVSMQRGGPPIGSIPTEIITEGSAGEFASSVRSKCFTCKNFDHKAWEKLRLYWGNSSDKTLFAKLNGVRYSLMVTNNADLSRRSEGIDGDFDVEHSLSQMGLCKPLTEINQDPVIVSPISTCPDNVCTPANPTGLYVPKDKEHARLANSAYDKIMRMAMGNPAEHSLGEGVLINIWGRLRPLYFSA